MGVELLAPGGNFDCVRAAVDSGADAVYFAGQHYGARSYAGNLSRDEIFAAVDYCHLFDVRTYVTVNTLMFDREFAGAEDFIRTLTEAGVDGVIIQDLGMLEYIQKLSPDIECHASTQMTVHSADGVKALEKMGVSRVVLSRELSGAEIRHIAETTDAELEVFVHGAMCMSYSGQCLMSSVIGGRSGNRGKCAQPCRLTYMPVWEKSGRYTKAQRERQYLSLKDMSLAEHICELDDIGVSSLKIEGRMKGTEYVSTVVGIYRRLIDEKRKPTKEETDSLNRIFNRGGQSDGYFTGKTGKNMFAFDRPDNPYLKNQGADLPKPKSRPVSIKAVFEEAKPPKVEFICGDKVGKAVGDNICQTAKNKPMTKESAAEKLKKLGGTSFYAKDAEVLIKGNPFLPVSEINELRRQAADNLKQELLRQYKTKRFLKPNLWQTLNKEFKENNINREKSANISDISCSVADINQYRRIRDMGIKRIYLPLYIAEQNIKELTEDIEGKKTEIILSPPGIITDSKRESYKTRLFKMKDLGFDKVEICTVDDINMTEGFLRYGGFRLNITNNLALKSILKYDLASVCLSAELTAVQLRDINVPTASKTQKEVIVYGKIPLMITKNCIMDNMGGCPCNSKDKKDKIEGMSDRTGRAFPITKNGDICGSVVLNANPLYLGDKPDILKKINADYIKLLFNDETPAECEEICKIYMSAKNGNTEKNINVTPIKEFTRLHMLKSPIE